MNTVQFKNNLYKNGGFSPNHSEKMVKDKLRSIEPTLKQLEYRDNLYKYCVQKGLVRDGFRLMRTKQGIKANIYALISILRKNGLADEFFGERKDK